MAKPTKISAKDNGIKKEKFTDFPLIRINFILMIIAAAMIIFGFLLMLGAPSTADAFNHDIYSTRRIVIGPLFSFLGFLFMAFAIIYRKKQS
ncbi:MAG: DUF3098 domain-containing protein [Muribaculaceae bacterium]|nr:DUF3098 domain-containing protein [Muribaculaceae bacterium]MDE5844192.1 DUF3098 domain-containing protein [Muribaculaceae bacterium]MDE7156231.1 DUF3098 domain-containing protein [Muribaculaceae bacterium]MDE7370044.1 DUF3098 domain-containing protein [Muribaculaceae bacterium]